MAELLSDGTVDFLGGQDASKVADRVPENAYYAGVNLNTKKASLGPRWGLEKKVISYPEGYVEDRYLRRVYHTSIFRTGKFQAAAPYKVGKESYLLIVIAGLIYLFNIRTNKLITVPITGGTQLNPRVPRLNCTEAGDYFVIFDFPAMPVVLKGLEARRASVSDMEIPWASTIGTFNQNRLFVGNAGNEFTSGDPVGSLAAPKAPISFKEVLTNGSPYNKQIFKLPTSANNEPITAMHFLQAIDTSTGIGSLLVGTSKAVYAYGTQAPRNTWEAGQFGSLIINSAGIAGPRAIASVNSDTFFLAPDGYARALSMSRSEQGRWSRVPMSTETENWLKPAGELAQFGFVSYFKNKVFFSANPFRVRATDFTSRLPIHDFAHGGLVVLGLDNVTQMGQTGKPAWDGLWTGVRPMEMVVIDERAFIISKDEQGTNEIWEMDPNLSYDTCDDKVRYVHGRMYTREYDFKNPFQNKELASLDLNFDNVQGAFKCDVAYKASHSNHYVPWGSISHNAPWRTFGMPSGGFINGFSPHHIRDLTIGSPGSQDSPECDPVTGEILKVLKGVQLRIDLQGKDWALSALRINALPIDTPPLDTSCSERSEEPTPKEYVDDWHIDGDWT